MQIRNSETNLILRNQRSYGTLVNPDWLKGPRELAQPENITSRPVRERGLQFQLQPSVKQRFHLLDDRVRINAVLGQQLLRFARTG